MFVDIYFFAILFLFVPVKCESTTAFTSHGPITGKSRKTLQKQQDFVAFLGIPFAKPPIGDLKFLDPRPIDAWDKTLVATKEKQACLQFNYNFKKLQPLGIYGSEDCLYLNIFTPGIDDEQRPIIVVLENNNFNNANNKTEYGPDFFIEEDIIVVNINHRLSIVGFLSLEDEVVPGNAGLKDIVMAIDWVKQNAKHFGGDPNKITLLGVDDGATAVDLLVHSNRKDLFNSVILQSGSSLNSKFLQGEAVERAFSLAEVLKNPCSSKKHLLSTLQDVPTADILPKTIQAVDKDYFKENQTGIIPFGPVIEKDPNGLLTEFPENFRRSIDIPILIGFNSLEGLEASLQFLMEPRYMSYVRKDLAMYSPVRVDYKFAPHDENYEDVVKNITQFYFNGQISIKTISNYVTYISDVLKTFNIDRLARHYSKITSNNVFYYHFDYESELNDNKRDIIKLATVGDKYIGAASGDELCYLFRCPGLKDKYLNYDPATSPEIIMQRKLVRLWANFVKFGNPIKEDDSILESLQWPPYDIETKQYLHIGSTLQVKSDLYKDRINFWEGIIQKYEQLLLGLSKRSHEEL